MLEVQGRPGGLRGWEQRGLGAALGVQTYRGGVPGLTEGCRSLGGGLGMLGVRGGGCPWTQAGLQQGCWGPWGVQRGARGGHPWPCWGCRGGPWPPRGHTPAPAHLQPLLFGHLPLVLLVRLVPDEDFLDAVWCVLGRRGWCEDTPPPPGHGVGDGTPPRPPRTPDLIHVARPLHDVLVGALAADVVHQEDALRERGELTPPLTHARTPSCLSFPSPVHQDGTPPAPYLCPPVILLGDGLVPLLACRVPAAGESGSALPPMA